MQTAQTRSVPVGRFLVAALLGVALIAAIGLLAMRDSIDLPMSGSSEAPAVAADDGVEPLTTAGHRYQVYLADGVTMSDGPARYQGASAIPADHSNHRIFAGETVRGDDGDYPENHRVGQQVD